MPKRPIRVRFWCSKDPRPHSWGSRVRIRHHLASAGAGKATNEGHKCDVFWSVCERVHRRQNLVGFSLFPLFPALFTWNLAFFIYTTFHRVVTALNFRHYFTFYNQTLSFFFFTFYKFHNFWHVLIEVSWQQIQNVAHRTTTTTLSTVKHFWILPIFHLKKGQKTPKLDTKCWHLTAILK